MAEPKYIQPDASGNCPDGYVWDSGSNSCIPVSYKYTPSNLGEPKWSSQQKDEDYISELIAIGVSEGDAKKRLQEKKKIQSDTRSKVLARGGSDAIELLDLVNAGADLTKHQDLIERVTKSTGISKSFPDNEDVFGFISIADNVSRNANPEYYSKKEKERQLQETQQAPERRKKFEQDLIDAGADKEEINYELKRYDSGNKGVGYAEYKAQQQTTTTPPIIPPSTPQGQVEFMQKQAEQVPASAPVMPKPKQSIPQTPAPNETTSRVPLPPLVNVGTLGSEPLPSTPQATPKTIQGGLGTQGFPQQALAIQEEAPSVSGGVSGNRQNEMMAIADNVEPGVYTDPNAIKAQDVAAKTVANQQGVNSTPVTQPNTQAVQQPKQKMSVLGKLKSLFGFNEENQNDISSFEDAGMTLDGTTGTETGTAVSQNQTLPENVVNSNQQTGTQTIGNETGNQTGTQTTGTQTTGGEIGVSNTRGGGTAPPPGATPGIVGGGGINLGAGSEFVRVMPGQVVETTDKKGVKSKSIEDLIEIGGSGFDDDVYARKLRRQAAMPELKNEDYYPNQPFSESRTAWGDPIFSGAGAQFPMAAYDAQRKARAQAELDEARKDIMQLKIPEIKTGAYYNAIRSGFTQQVKDIVNDAVARAGGNYQKAKRILDQEGKLALAQSEWQGTAKMIDEKADVATAYLNKARENPGNLYFPFEGVTAATDFLNGMNEFANGRITAAQLNELDKRMVSADKWEKFKQENMGKLKPTDYIPTPEQLKNSTLEDREAFKAVQLDLGGKAPDFNTWLYTQKYTEAALPQVMDGIVQPFFDQEKTAAEQLVRPGEKLEDAKLRVARGIAALFGRQYSQGTVTQNRKSDTNINVNTGTPSTETGFYYNTAVAQPQIKEYLTSQFEAVRSGKMTPKQALQEAYKLADKSGSWIADNTYMRVTTPGKWASIKEEVNPIPYSEMFIPTQSGGFQPYDAKTATGNANESANTQPAHSVILDTERAWMIPDGDGFKMISQEQYKKLGMPESAISYRIDKVNTYRTIDDFKESGGAKDPKTGQWVISPELMKTGSKNAGKIAYQIYPETVEGVSDLDVMGSKDTKTKSSGPGKATKISVSKSVENL